MDRSWVAGVTLSIFFKPGYCVGTSCVIDVASYVRKEQLRVLEWQS